MVIFRGIGGVREGISTPLHHSAAVAVMKGNGSVKGLARLVQVCMYVCMYVYIYIYIYIY